MMEAVEAILLACIVVVAIIVLFFSMVAIAFFLKPYGAVFLAVAFIGLMFISRRKL